MICVLELVSDDKMEVVAEIKRRRTIRFLAINGHIQVCGSTVVPQLTVRTLQCIQSLLYHWSHRTFYTNYNVNDTLHVILSIRTNHTCPCSVRTYVTMIHVRATFNQF